MFTKTITVEKVVEVPVVKLVEVEDVTPLTGGDSDEDRLAIAALQYNPGFIALNKRLAFQQAALKSKLSFERINSLEQAQFLQAGIFWSGWLKNEIKRATTKVAKPVRDAEAEELRAFRELDAQLERIG